MVWTTNRVWGGTTDEVVSVKVSWEGITGGVVSDAHVLEFSGELESCSSGKNATSIFYSGVLIEEV